MTTCAFSFIKKSRNGYKSIFDEYDKKIIKILPKKSFRVFKSAKNGTFRVRGVGGTSNEYRQLSLLPKWGEELITLHLHSKAALLGLPLALLLSFLEASVGPSPSCPGKCRHVWAGFRCLLDTPVLGWPGILFSSFTFSLSPSPGT